MLRALIVCGLLLLCQKPVWADGRDIDKAIALYDDLEYGDAIAVLEKALKGSDLSKGQRVEGLRYLGLGYVVLGRYVDAKSAFKRLLKLKPNYRLPQTENPRARDLLRELRSATQTEVALDMLVSLDPTPPVLSGSSLHFTVAIAGRNVGAVSKVVVKHRKAGTKTYSSVVAKSAGANRFRGTISGAFFNASLEYYVLGLGTDGKTLVAEGTSKSPVFVPVKERGGTSTVLYKRWWFWTSIAGTAVAGAAGYLFLRDSDDHRPIVEVIVD